MRLVDAEQMQYMDHFTITKVGIPGLVLMENAARSWVSAAEPYVENCERVFVFCGSGNNGGDGYAIARILQNKGFQVYVIAVKPPKSADCIKNSNAWKHYGPTVSLENLTQSEIQLNERDLLVDAVLGTGIETPLRGELISILEAMDALPGFKIAVDIPSGISASTGDQLGVAVSCDVTITFQKEKVGHYLNPGLQYRGELICQKISIQEQFAPTAQPFFAITREMVQKNLPIRPADSYKNMFGHLLTFCGAPGTLGASYLASASGLKVGTGLVTMALPKGYESTFLSTCPELMSCSQEELTPEKIEAFNALVVGCGLGRDSERWKGISSLLKKVHRPLVIDADAFYGVKNFSQMDLSKSILTPHPGELSQMTGEEKPKTNRERLQQGMDFVKKYKTTLVMKGAPTLVFTAKGDIYINTTGNSGMATAGSGDVLSGILGGLLAQGVDSETAAILGVWLHGKSGDGYQIAQNEESLTATNLIENIGKAITSVKA